MKFFDWFVSPQNLMWPIVLVIVANSVTFYVLGHMAGTESGAPEAIKIQNEDLRDKARTQCEFAVKGALEIEEIQRQSTGSDRDPETVASFTWQGQTHTVTKQSMKNLKRDVNGCGAIYKFLGMEDAKAFEGLAVSQ